MYIYLLINILLNKNNIILIKKKTYIKGELSKNKYIFLSQ